jgi:hypothetical protein
MAREGRADSGSQSCRPASDKHYLVRESLIHCVPLSCPRDALYNFDTVQVFGPSPADGTTLAAWEQPRCGNSLGAPRKTWDIKSSSRFPANAH